MHSLMTDLARNVASDDYLLIERPKQQITDCIFHLSLFVGSSSESPPGLLSAKKMRSLLVLSDSSVQYMDRCFSRMKCLRSLDLSKASCNSLPDSIGELKHLRYIRLGSGLESLPCGITKLSSLFTLDIRNCYKLKELPRSFNKLIKLRNLHNGKRLIDMPPGFGQLTSLQALDIFTVGESNGIDALGSMGNLAGELKICHVKHRPKVVSEAQAAKLKDKKMTNLFLTWASSYVAHCNEEEELLRWLQPPPSVKRLKVWSWKGVRFPLWGMNNFPFLVSISIRSCHRCEYLPSFSRLPHLRLLRLCDLRALEYIESDDVGNGTSSAAAYFPSLESLLLSNLPELKGWSRGGDSIYHQRNGCHQSQKQRFPCLSELGIDGCPKLMSIPVVPKLESLDANEIHGKLLKDLISAGDSPSLSTLNWLHIHSVQELVTLTIDVFVVESLTISECQELTELIAKSSTSLHRLVIDECCKLTEISSALQQLYDLKELEIRHCEVLDLGYNSLTAWQGLTGLCSLELRDIPKLEMLPEGAAQFTLLQKLKIVHLTNLRVLPDWLGNLRQLHLFEILECSKLRALPQSFRSLTSLQEFRISNCPELERRCQCPNGEDWPLIQHIPYHYIG